MHLLKVRTSGRQDLSLKCSAWNGFVLDLISSLIDGSEVGYMFSIPPFLRDG